MTLADRIAAALQAFRSPPLLRGGRGGLSSVTSQVADDPGWMGLTAGSNELDLAQVQEGYKDALTAWRKNPMAKRIIDVTTDFCLGDGLTPTAPGLMGRFIAGFWDHPKNRMAERLPILCDELSRAGDLFITLHRNPEDGMSYIRPIPKDTIIRIETLPNDWETELSFEQISNKGLETRTWLSIFHPDAAASDAVMIHYKINAIVGAQLGESDIATLIPWLQRYSRMLEDRVRLNWALKSFLWSVTVPTNMVAAKREQYSTPPEGGTVIIKDEQEKWEALTPNLHGFDANYDLHAVRLMIDAGSGLPPHWRSEATDVSLATANAMERSASRHLRRRQLYLKHLVIDLAFTAYGRAYEINRVRARPNKHLIECSTPDLSRQDNADLATAAKTMAEAMGAVSIQLPGSSATLRKRMLDLIFRFAGEQLTPPEIDQILAELGELPSAPIDTEPNEGAPVPGSLPPEPQSDPITQEMPETEVK